MAGHKFSRMNFKKLRRVFFANGTGIFTSVFKRTSLGKIKWSGYLTLKGRDDFPHIGIGRKHTVHE